MLSVLTADAATPELTLVSVLPLQTFKVTIYLRLGPGGVVFNESKARGVYSYLH